jgi:hypothetical protein
MIPQVAENASKTLQTADLKGITAGLAFFDHFLCGWGLKSRRSPRKLPMNRSEANLRCLNDAVEAESGVGKGQILQQ